MIFKASLVQREMGFAQQNSKGLSLLSFWIICKSTVSLYNPSVNFVDRHRAKDIDELLTDSLCKDEKELMDKILLELSAAAKRKTEVVYRRGLRDDVLILNFPGAI